MTIQKKNSKLLINKKAIHGMVPNKSLRETCLLWRNWSWTHLAALTFDKAPYISQPVDSVMWRHEGSILQFILFVERYDPSAFYRWIETLQRQTVGFLNFQLSSTEAQFKVLLSYFRVIFSSTKELCCQTAQIMSFSVLAEFSPLSCSIDTTDL